MTLPHRQTPLIKRRALLHIIVTDSSGLQLHKLKSEISFLILIFLSCIEKLHSSENQKRRHHNVKYL